MWIYLLRHGESEANVAGIISDDPAHAYRLTAQGVAQARAAARALRAVPFSHIYVSEHRRTQETAEVMREAWREEGAGAGQCPVTMDPRLNERRSGLDGRPVDDFNDLVRPDPVYLKPEGGESFVEQMQRLRAFLDETAGRHPNGTVLAVSHENPIMAARALAGLDPEQAARGGVGNCEWVVLEWPVQGGD